jgi:hypothetical protein
MNKEDYISDEQVVKRAQAAVKLAIERKKVTENPIVVYDRETQNIYNINSDGTREIVGQRRTVGRYSERFKKQ